MPRGVYVRKPRSDRFDNKIDRVTHIEPAIFETDEEIEQKLNDRFDVLSEMTDACLAGDVRAMIVSGPAGLGKSYTVETTLEKWDPSNDRHEIVRGYVRATSLFRLLHRHRNPGNVLVFDDSDSIFNDDNSLNLLKAACDTNKKRTISYMTEAALVDEETAESLPKTFEFNGTIIFITNRDFDADIDRGHKFAPHMQAMISRSHYVDLAMRTQRDYMMQIRRVVRQGLLANSGLSIEQQEEVVKFVETNSTKLRELSLRMVLKVATIRKRSGDRWLRNARVTCCR